LTHKAKPVYTSLLKREVLTIKEEENMRTLKVIILAGLIGLATTFTGCGGGGAKVKSETVTTTLGQELMDLDAAYKKGVITEKEYEKAKKAALKKYNK
jgi:hypothetical protein